MIPTLLLSSLAAPAAGLFQSSAPAAQASAVAPAESPLLDQRALQLALARLATEHPSLVSVLPVGTSRGGRRIEALRIAAGELTAGRPALLIVAGLEGPLAWTSTLALDQARALATGHADDVRTRALLEGVTVYVIPRANPDACEARFLKPLSEVLGTGTGVDDDRDGRQGEDPPADVDGDGLLTWMRVPDPEGEWLADPLDARASVKADRAQGQRGLWKLVREGFDTDGDGEASEDAPLDAEVNRNFPQGWIEHARESGRFATDEPATRALCDFVLARKDIALVLTWGLLDNVVEQPKTGKEGGRRSANPSEGIPEADAALLAELGKRFKDLGCKAAKGDGRDAGSFQAWVQAQRGLWTVNLAPWSIPLEAAAKKDGADGADKSAREAGTPEDGAKEGEAEPARGGRESRGGARGERERKADEPSDEIKRLRWIDAQGETARFVPWKAFTHPQLGPVEIGGFAPYALHEPPAATRAELARSNLPFVLLLGESLPRLRLADATAKDLGQGLWRIEAALSSEALLPLTSALGRRAGELRPARVRLVLPSGARLLSGSAQTLVRELPGSGGRHKLEWLVLGAPPGALRIEADSDHAGTARATPEVKR